MIIFSILKTITNTNDNSKEITIDSSFSTLVEAKEKLKNMANSISSDGWEGDTKVGDATFYYEIQESWLYGTNE